MGSRVEKGVRHNLVVPTIIRGLYRQTDGHWEAYTLEFGLAAQADTLELAKQKIEEQITDYLRLALNEHREHAEELLTRKAPLWAFAIYHAARLSQSRKAARKVRLFEERLPALAPV